MTLPTQRLGLVWLDAHGDFNTPDLDPSGFLDGQGLAMAVGRCWNALTSTVPGFTPVAEQRVLHLGARSFGATEGSALDESAITVLSPAQARDFDVVAAAFDYLATEADLVHLHIDLDVHDPSIAPAAAPDGLSSQDVQRVARQCAGRLPVASATLASYDPAYDPDARMQETALVLLELLASIASPATATAVS